MKTGLTRALPLIQRRGERTLALEPCISVWKWHRCHLCSNFIDQASHTAMSEFIRVYKCKQVCSAPGQPAHQTLIYLLSHVYALLWSVLALLLGQANWTQGSNSTLTCHQLWAAFPSLPRLVYVSQCPGPQRAKKWSISSSISKQRCQRHQWLQPSNVSPWALRELRKEESNCNLLLLFGCLPFGTTGTAAHQAPLSSTVSQSLLKFLSAESVMLSNHLILCCPLRLLLSISPSVTVFCKELALHIRWPNNWNFSFSNRPFNEYSGWRREWQSTPVFLPGEFHG